MAPGGTRTCQHCRTNFVIEPEDFDFYKKIAVPPPTFCPRCRMQRRMTWRNERSLYKRKCSAPGHDEEIVSIYSPDKPFVVYDQKYWWSDGWDPFAFGRPYDFSKPFFQQFRELLERVPLLALSNSNATNSDYCNVADQSKCSYMVSGSYKVENVLYANRVYNTKDSMDLYVAHRDELCYEDVHCSDCYRVYFSKQSYHCTDSAFLYDCKNCSHCLGCVNLRNKQHCIFNVQYSKEDYFEKLKEFDLGSFRHVALLRKRLEELYLQSLHKYAAITKSTNVRGDNVDNAKNCQICFDVTEGAEDCKYLHWGGLQTKDVYDGGPGVGIVDLAYEIVDTGLQGSRIAFTNVVYGSHDVRYALFCHNCSDIFGCIGLRSKQYCILNRPYSKEEYETLLSRIVPHMGDMPYRGLNGKEYRYGEFFPAEIAPFSYNESIAQDYFPLTRQEALRKGYQWKDHDERHYRITKQASELPDRIGDASEEILGEVIGCEHQGSCGEGCLMAFKITPAELRLYRQMNLPLPRRCFACRHVARFAQRNPLKLWHRRCTCGGTKSENGIYANTVAHVHDSAPCPNEFETSYAPDRSEIVYCEQCYQAEVA